MRNRFGIFGTLSDVTEDGWIEAEEEPEARLRFLSGADCRWTAIDGSAAFYCRRNGRTFRIVQGKDRRWSLFLVEIIEDEVNCSASTRGEATEQGTTNDWLRK
ncbi:hypothetical protein LRP30_32980 [Bradyrhizobium sp. C-145]|uniref:hypothetical protein n=1 Tax=Bradyrhizobium sp. C-145 TaxID=574727 RepID=UPI00201B593C|nr:hypothetical protein [Bradyrhizobium sp. C-145]UQR61603.1 hypothetical protein LRP30_32980 [Bradyrhizobium sp. C-145]